MGRGSIIFIRENCKLNINKYKIIIYSIFRGEWWTSEGVCVNLVKVVECVKVLGSVRMRDCASD